MKSPSSIYRRSHYTCGHCTVFQRMPEVRPVLGSLSEMLVYHSVFQFASIALNSGRGWIRVRVANWIVGIQANTSLSNYSIGQSDVFPPSCCVVHSNLDFPEGSSYPSPSWSLKRYLVKNIHFSKDSILSYMLLFSIFFS